MMMDERSTAPKTGRDFEHQRGTLLQSYNNAPVELNNIPPTQSECLVSLGFFVRKKKGI